MSSEGEGVTGEKGRKGSKAARGGREVLMFIPGMKLRIGSGADRGRETDRNRPKVTKNDLKVTPNDRK